MGGLTTLTSCSTISPAQTISRVSPPWPQWLAQGWVWRSPADASWGQGSQETLSSLLRQLAMKLMRYRWRTQKKPEKVNRERKAGARGKEKVLHFVRNVPDVLNLTYTKIKHCLETCWLSIVGNEFCPVVCWWIWSKLAVQGGKKCGEISSTSGASQTLLHPHRVFTRWASHTDTSDLSATAIQCFWWTVSHCSPKF